MWLAVTIEGDEFMTSIKPLREKECTLHEDRYFCIGKQIFLSKGTIKRLIGKDFKWEDDPVKISEALITNAKNYSDSHTEEEYQKYLCKISAEFDALFSDYYKAEYKSNVKKG